MPLFVAAFLFLGTRKTHDALCKKYTKLPLKRKRALRDFINKLE
jgi:hypothetical protein